MEDLVHLLEVEASLLLKQVDVVLIGEGLWLLTHLNSVSFFNPMLVKSVFSFLFLLQIHTQDLCQLFMTRSWT